ncbi:hypothetical protein KKG31_00095 [Patescibacteria group bacterium]|nr:hypothetical protein [Patescibacteria group bacterium]MBU1757591.1 hypothetical protein [Patescibacteria group bacterium]
MIGDIYTQNGQYQRAEESYIKALSLTNNDKEQKTLKNKISQLDNQ